MTLNGVPGDGHYLHYSTIFGSFVANYMCPEKKTKFFVSIKLQRF